MDEIRKSYFLFSMLTISAVLLRACYNSNIKNSPEAIKTKNTDVQTPDAFPIVDTSTYGGFSELYLPLDKDIEYYFSAGSNGILPSGEKDKLNSLFSGITEELFFDEDTFTPPIGGIFFWLRYAEGEKEIDLGFGSASMLGNYTGYYIVRAEKTNEHNIPLEDDVKVSWYAVDDALGKEITAYYDSIYR